MYGDTKGMDKAIPEAALRTYGEPSPVKTYPNLTECLKAHELEKKHYARVNRRFIIK